VEFKGRIGSWEIVERLGSGGMGSVYRCRNVHRPSMEVAIKLLDAGAPSGAGQRFQREADVLVRLDHPNIVRIRDFVVEDMRPLLVMDLVEGRTLQEVRNSRLLDEAGVAAVGAQLASALAHAHRVGVCHRDIKPANAIVRPDGRVVLVDWGIALDEAQARVTATMKLSPATFYYAPPEWILGDRADPRAWDAYSLGVVLYELLSRPRAFRTDKLASPMQSVQALFRQKNERGPLAVEGTGPAMRDLLAAMTAVDPNARLANMNLVATELRGIAASTLPTGVVSGGDLLLDTLERELRPLFEEEELDQAALSVSSNVPLTGEHDAPRVVGTRVAAQLGPRPDPQRTQELKRRTEQLVVAIADATGTFPAVDPLSPELAGRDEDLAAVVDALDRGERAVVLLGPAGVGRSALARAATASRSPETTRSASLRGAAGAMEQCARVAEALGVPLGRDPEGQLARALAGHGPLLLLLDDVPVSAEALLGDWLPAAPALQLLVVGDGPLALPGVSLTIGELDLPTADNEAAMRSSGAGRLFLQAAAQAGCEPSPQDFPTLHGILHEVGGLPLALQVVASQSGTRTLDAILEHLQDRPERPRSSLELAVDASLDTLAVADRALFSRLGLLHGPAAVSFLESMVEEPLRPVREGIDRLEALGLVTVEVGLDGVERIDLDPTLRQVAAAKLGDEGVTPTEARLRHTGALASRVDSEVLATLRFSGPVAAARWLLVEIKELEAGFAASEADGDGERATRIGEALCAALEHRGPASAALDRARRLGAMPGLKKAGRRVAGLAEARALRGLGRPEEAEVVANRTAEDGFRGGDRRLLAQAFAEIGWAQLQLGRGDDARQHFRTGAELAEGPESAWCLLGQADCDGLAGKPTEQRARLNDAVALAEDVGALALQALAHAQLGRLLARGADLALAEAHLDAALVVAEGLGSAALQAQVLLTLGEVARGRGDLATARDRITAALNQFRRLGTLRAEAVALSELAGVQRLDDDPEAAAVSLRESARLLDGGSPLDLARIQGNLGDVLRELGRRDEARAALDEAVEQLEDLGAPIDAAVLLGSSALLAARSGDYPLASWHLDRAESVLREVGPSDALGLLLARKAQVAARAGQRSAALAAHAEAGLIAEALNLGRASALMRALAQSKSELGS